jgi:O-antigen/teichoic acid export membrane protein
VSSLIARVASLSLSNVVSIAIGLVLIPIQARLLDPAIWGAVQLAARIGDMASAVVLPGLSEAAMQSAVRGHHGNYARMQALRFQASTRLALAIALLAACYVLAGSTDAGLMIFAWAAAFPWLTLGQNVPDAWLAALGEVRTLARMRVVQSLTSLTAAVGVFVAPASWTYALWILAGLLACSGVGERTARAACRNAETDDAVMELGQRMNSARQFNNLIGNSEALILSWVLGLHDLAVWLAALALSRYVKVVVINILVTLQPRFYADEPWTTKLANLLPLTRAYFVAASLGCAAAWVWGQPALELLLGGRWRESASLGAMLTAAYVLSTVTDFYGQMITAQRDVAFDRTFNLLTPVVNVSATTALGLWGGLPGVALARLLTWITIALIRLVFMLRYAPGRLAADEVR